MKKDEIDGLEFLETINVSVELPIGDNAFGVMGVFRRAALEQGFAKQQIERILTEAMDGDYDHLCETLQNNCV